MFTARDSSHQLLPYRSTCAVVVCIVPTPTVALAPCGVHRAASCSDLSTCAGVEAHRIKGSDDIADQLATAFQRSCIAHQKLCRREQARAMESAPMRRLATKEACATVSTPMRRLATASRNALGAIRQPRATPMKMLLVSLQRRSTAQPTLPSRVHGPATGRVAAAETLRRHIRTLLLRQHGRCGVTLSDCCCGSRDVAASHSQTAVAAAETLRRHAQRSLSGNKDVAASHSQVAIVVAVALKRHVRGLRLRQQRCCGVTLGDLCSGSRDVAASHSQRQYD